MTDSKDPQQFRTVNPDTGFLEVFAPAFRTFYASEPHFVHAAADMLTLALVAVYRKNGLLRSEETIARCSSDEAVQALRSLVGKTGAKDSLFGSTMRGDPPDAFEQQVDAILGRGFFARWIVAFEAGEYERAAEILGAASPT